jgi:hypothetical protein
MRTLVWLLPLCAALAACNMAISDHPMLSGEPRSALKLKDGLWAVDDPDCKFHAARPVRRWPKCARWLVIKAGKIVGGKDLKPLGLPVELVIADGKPLILQFPFTGESDDKKKVKAYTYLALEPRGSDPAGSIVDMQSWSVACGVEDPGDALRSKVQHFPGMNEDCNPESVEAIRTAAAAGPQGSDKKERWRWVRARAN